MKLIAITGGIGCGKSVVARMVKIMGYEVYDCDSRAKALMINDPEVKKQLIMAFGEQTYLDDGTLNRQHLSDLAFADSNALACINGIVHPATARDLQRWADSQARRGAKLAFVETALLRTAGLDRVVDSVWHVTAPTDIRIRRVMTRSGLTAQQVKDRIAAQVAEDNLATGEHAIINDNTTALLPHVLQLLIQE